MAIHITGDAAADELLSTDPFALLVGMMLDQQYPMEHAFRGPAKLLDRFGNLDPAKIASADPEEFAALTEHQAHDHVRFHRSSRYGRRFAAYWLRAT